VLHFTVTQTYENQFEEVKRTNADIWTPQLEMELCSAKLYLYAMTFIIPSQTNDDCHQQIHRQSVLQKGLKAASGYITEAVNVSQLPVASGFYPGGHLTFAPKQYFTSLFSATTFLFRYLATYTTGTAAQESLAMGSIIEAHKIFQSFPGNRDMTRAAIHTEMLVSILRDKSPSSMPGLMELAITNRLGASVMYDAIFRSSAHMNRDSITGASTPVHEWKSMNTAHAERLPKAVWECNVGESGNTSKSNADGMEGLDSNSSELSMQDPNWWAAWEAYMDCFEVGHDGLWPDIKQSEGGFGDFVRGQAPVE
jgi:hypothetical protein